MNHYRYLVLILIAAVGLSAYSPVIQAQGDKTCSEVVKVALEATKTSCTETGRDQACYGNKSVLAQPRTENVPLSFENPGDMVNLRDIKGLQMSAMADDNSVWGISLMRMQVYLLDAPTTDAEILLFGDTAVEDAGIPDNAVTLEISARGDADIFSVPERDDSYLIARLKTGQTAMANGRNEAGNWLRIIV